MSSLFIIGAGFSKPAGLPLGTELFSRVVDLAKKRWVYDSLKRDIDKYIEYVQTARVQSIGEDDINLEEFVTYLDIEHKLELNGSDRWSDEGNVNQLLVRNLIGLAIYLAQNSMSHDDLDLYREFARRLQPGDCVLTFNYDTILETVFDELDINYRLYPFRYKVSERGSLYVDQDDTDVILLKMHGSIDWFDRAYYDSVLAYATQLGDGYVPPHLVFNTAEFSPIHIVDPPIHNKDPLINIYRIDNLGEYFSKSELVIESPMIVSPSYQKLLYINPLIGFWRDLYKAGIDQNKLAIIGFSLPEYDEYVRQPLYILTRNFQNFNYYGDKTNLKIVDFRKTDEEIKEFKNNYRFVNWDKTDCFFDGFNMEAIKMIFDEN